MEKNKLQKVGTKLQQAGCALTIMFTIPIVAVFFGPVGYIIAVLFLMLGLLMFIGVFVEDK